MDGTDVLVGLSVSSYTDAAQEAKVEKNTAVQAYQYFRDICSWRLLNHHAPFMLGGPGVVVHIDESLFRHKPMQGMVHLYDFCSLSDCQHFYHDVLQNHRGRPPPASVGFWSM